MKTENKNPQIFWINRHIIVTVISAIVILLLITDVVIGVTFWILKEYNSQLYYRFFDHRDAYLTFARKNEAFFSKFIEDYYDPILGWNNPKSKHLKSQGCIGHWEAYYNEDGSRKINGFDAEERYVIICVGDSFTHGNETDDHSTFPAFLQTMTNVKVGNFGVGGYDVIQSVLQYENVLKRIDSPVIGILCILYENGRRNLNAFRPVYSNRNDLYETFFFKPFFDGTEMRSSIVPINENSFKKSLQKADTMFTGDYWAKPKFDFPYSFSLFRSLSCPYFVFMANQKMNRLIGKGMYDYDFNSTIILDGLTYCIKRFVEVSHAHAVYPVIVFLPPNTQDLSSPNRLIAKLHNTYKDALLLNFGNHSMNWNDYIIREGCHPTPSGYKEIAAFIYKNIIELRLLP